MSSASFNPFAGGELLRVAPTTGPQREIIASAQFSDIANTAFNEAVSVRLEGPMDTERLRGCFDTLIARHDILRATFSRNGLSLCLQETAPFDLHEQDISSLSAGEQEKAIQDLWKNVAISPMNLEEGPLLSAWLLKLAPDAHELVMAAHHVICDGWSIGLMISELASLYGAGGSEDAGEAMSFFDYAERLDATQISNRDNDYWIERFSDLPASLDLPLDYPRPHFRTFDAARLDYRLDAQLAKALPKAAAGLKVSMVNMVLAGYVSLLHRLTGNTDIVVGLPVAGQATQNRLKQMGHMVHLLPIRIALDANTLFADLCQQVKATVLDATEHANFTFGKLIEAIDVDRTRVPLITTIFNIDQPLEKVQFGDLSGKLRTVPRAAENFEMFLNILPSSDSLTIEATYSTTLFRRATIVSWMAALEHLLAGATAEPGKAIGHLPLCQQESPAVEAANETTTELAHQTFLAAFDQQLAAHINDPAVRFRDRTFTYDALGETSLRVARHLLESGVKPGDTVALCAERSDNALAAILGIFRASAVYLPLDPDFPESRLQYMVEDSGAAAILIDDTTPAALRETSTRTLNLEQASQASSETQLPETGPQPTDPAYIIYTSGSTGKPKGVVIPHRALANFLQSMANKPGCSDYDRLLAVTTFSFDIAFLELLLPLACGATTVIADKDAVKDGEKLRELIKEHNITILQATPATWRMLLDTEWPTDGTRIKGLCGGEPLPQDLVKDLLGNLSELWNMYGPTETTVWSTCHQVRHTDRTMSVGKPIQNTQVHILDQALQPVPVSCPGELYIGGQGLAEGYHNRTDLTEQKYIQHPRFGRLYATGDLAKWTPDGTLQHLGRIDDQVKVRGYRIELGDIDAALASCHGVKTGYAYVWELSPGDVRIVGCVVPETGEAPNQVAMRKELRKRLPAYMVPQHILEIENVPLSPSGKVDRKRLPRPEIRESSILKATALANETEEMVAGIWSDVLNSQSRIVREDNFFSLGGHSLLALQVIRKIEAQTGIRLPPEDMVGLSLSEIADKLTHTPAHAQDHEDSPADLPAAAQRRLSEEQKRLLVRQLSAPDNVCNNLPASWMLEGALDLERFGQSLAKVFERQTALRTIISLRNSEYQQTLLPLKQTPVLEVVDLSDRPNAAEVALERSRDLAFQPFTVLNRPLFRSVLFLLGSDRYHYVFVPHQLVFDGWSFDIFLKELEDTYQVLSGTRQETSNKLAFEFRDYTEWASLRGPVAADRDFHKGQLASVLDAVTDSSAEPMDNRCARQTLAFSRADLSLLESSASSLGIKTHELLFALFAIALGQARGEDQLVIGVPSVGRVRPDVINLIGSFVTTLPCRFDLPKQGVRAQLLAIVEQLRGALVHQGVTYADIVQGSPAQQSVFPDFVPASFAYQDIRNRPTAIADLKLTQLDLPRQNTEYALEFWTRVQPDGFLGVFDYNELALRQEQVASVSETFARLIRNLDSLLAETPASTEAQPATPRQPFWKRLFQ